jgi:hypothetical protein
MDELILMCNGSSRVELPDLRAVVGWAVLFPYPCALLDAAARPEDHPGLGCWA